MPSACQSASSPGPPRTPINSWTPTATKNPSTTVLTEPSAVAFYADAGNIVATNPDRTVGIDVASYREAATCHRLFTEALADFE